MAVAAGVGPWAALLAALIALRTEHRALEERYRAPPLPEVVREAPEGLAEALGELRRAFEVVTNRTSSGPPPGPGPAPASCGADLEEVRRVVEASCGPRRAEERCEQEECGTSTGWLLASGLGGATLSALAHHARSARGIRPVEDAGAPAGRAGRGAGVLRFDGGPVRGGGVLQ